MAFSELQPEFAGSPDRSAEAHLTGGEEKAYNRIEPQEAAPEEANE